MFEILLTLVITILTSSSIASANLTTDQELSLQFNKFSSLINFDDFGANGQDKIFYKDGLTMNGELCRLEVKVTIISKNNLFNKAEYKLISYSDYYEDQSLAITSRFDTAIYRESPTFNKVKDAYSSNHLFNNNKLNINTSNNRILYKDSLIGTVPFEKINIQDSVIVEKINASSFVTLTKEGVQKMKCRF